MFDFSDFIASNKQIYLRHEGLFQSSAKALKDCFNFDRFHCYRITNSGSYSALDSNPEIQELNSTVDFFTTHPMMCAPKYHQMSLRMMDLQEYPDIVSARNLVSHGINFALIFSRSTHNSVQNFVFNACDLTKEQYCDTIGHVPDLRRFIDWFLEQHTQLVREASLNQVHLPELLGDQFYNNKLHVLDPNQKQIELLFNELGLPGSTSLSDNAKHVLRLLARGFTANEVAQELSTPKRTIEHRIEALMKKLNCSSRACLIEKARIRGIA